MNFRQSPVVSLAILFAVGSFAAVIVQDPSSPIELRPLGDLSQGTCTNGAPPPSLWTIIWSNATCSATSSNGSTIIPFGRFHDIDLATDRTPNFNEGFVWAENLHPDHRDGTICVVDSSCEDGGLGTFLDMTGRSLLSFPAHALWFWSSIAGGKPPSFNHGLAFVRLCDGNVYGISTNGTILDVHEKVGPFVYFRGFYNENPYLFYHGDCALVILLDGKFAVLDAKHDLAFPPSDDASFVEKRWKEELEALGKKPLHRFPTNGLIDRVDRIFDEMIFPGATNARPSNPLVM